MLHRPRLHRPPARRFGEQPAWPSWRDGATLSFGTQMDWPSACVAEWLTKVRLDGLQHSCLPSTRSSPSARCLTTQITLHRVCRAVCRAVYGAMPLCTARCAKVELHDLRPAALMPVMVTCRAMAEPMPGCGPWTMYRTCGAAGDGATDGATAGTKVRRSTRAKVVRQTSRAR